MYIISAEERRALHAEDFKNLKSYIGCTTLKRGGKKLKVDKGKKRFVLKMITSVIIVVAGLFQKQMENEEEHTNEDEYMY